MIFGLGDDPAPSGVRLFDDADFSLEALARLQGPVYPFPSLGSGPQTPSYSLIQNGRMVVLE
mgnify:CR=1 FL=1